MTYSLFNTAGKKIPIEEGRSSIVEIPKGDGDLGLSVSQCERTVSLLLGMLYKLVSYLSP